MPLVRNVRAPLSPRYTITGIDSRPDTLEWAKAGDAEKRRYYRILARKLAQAKDAELAAGLDWRGSPLKPIRPATWDDRLRKYLAGEYTAWTGPPLTPQNEGSRTRRLHQVAATKDRVIGYWSRRWGKAVRGHCLGSRGLPVRDVCGATDRAWKDAVASASLEWSLSARRYPVPAKPVVLIPGANPKLPGRLLADYRKEQRKVEKYPFLRAFKAAWVPPGRGAPPPPAAPGPRPVFGGAGKKRSFLGRVARAAAAFLGSLF